ncbi:MAG TPA: nitronate monooxygenase [Acidimicrobiales bacterium]|nr:nitronate monooxygenase [Acidimicrobiales bacterium]
MKTRLTDMLGVEHPVMLAGMGGVSYHEVVAAVSEAGGYGTLGASTMGDALVEEMRGVKKLTSKPFGVDLLTAVPGQVEKQVETVIKEGATVFVAGLGVPRDVVDMCHDNNVLVATVCGKVKHTVAAVAAGCDFVIAQGTEGGGHTGVIGTLPLVAQSVDAVGDKVPVVAAGGIHDGRGLAAALALGADGVWVGTRFIATPEAWGVAGYKDVLLGLPEDGTVISRAFTGKTCRVVRNDYTQKYEDDPSSLQPFPQQAIQSMKDGVNHLGAPPSTQVDVKTEFMPAGQGVGAINELIPAAELVRMFVREAEATLDRLTSLRSTPVSDI